MTIQEGHKKGAGGQKDTVTFAMVNELAPKKFAKLSLPASDLEEMKNKVEDTLILTQKM